jgi:voltage-gated potassium channel
VIIIIGVGIFGTFTGYLANLFLAPKKPPPEYAAPAADDLRAKVNQLSALVAQQQSALDEIDRLLPADDT